jgi:signal transduction histidine kinase
MAHTRILVVDDDPHAYHALRVLLTDEGYLVDLAESAARAFEMIAENLPDLVLTDLQMPEMDGIALCRSLYAYDPGLPVIVVTGFADTALAVQALQAGAEDYLTKPVELDQLLLSIQRAIERRAAAVERQHLRERTEELYRQALAAVAAHEEVLSVVAHDLRTPLGVISAWAQQLLSDESVTAFDRPAKSGLASISRNALRMQRLIADLLDESRLRTGQLPLEYEEHLLSQLLADVSELRPLAQQKHVRLDVVPPARDRLVACDRARMSQVLGNLLANAVKFSPPGGTVTVSVDDDEAGTRFAVHDDGPGIAPDALPRIFDRFWQTKKGHGGVGLGLYIVKGIVESHGGQVCAESQLGGGSTFYVSLPQASRGRDTRPLERGEENSQTVQTGAPAIMRRRCVHEPPRRGIVARD